jgi:uncharacterized damage-inducible protein DinB
MTDYQLSLTPFYKGWDVYQQLLVQAITPLTPDQLALRSAPHMWSIGQLVTHMVATRVGWFHMWMSEGSPDIAQLAAWDENEEPSRAAVELVAGLEMTWQMIQQALARWTPADLEQTFQNPYLSEAERKAKPARSRQWIIWHVLEHDLHHGGEVSQALGMHGLVGLDL